MPALRAALSRVTGTGLRTLSGRLGACLVLIGHVPASFRRLTAYPLGAVPTTADQQRHRRGSAAGRRAAAGYIALCLASELDLMAARAGRRDEARLVGAHDCLGAIA